MENNSSKMLIGALLAVLVIGGGILLATSSDDSNNNEANTSQTSQSTSNSANQQTNDQPEQETANIVELAQATDSLSVLVSAVVEADLVGTLSSEGPFTVFAPTNDAFTNLINELDTTAEELLARDDLADILTYHVVAGKVMAADLSDGQVIETVQGGTLTVAIHDGSVTLEDANGNTAMVVSADVEASNGVVHVIDTVVLP